MKPYATDYDYEDDSDLEGEDDEDDSGDEPVAAPRGATEESGNESSELIKTENPDAKGGNSSDIISVSDLDSLFTESSDTQDGVRPPHVGKVVLIEEVAFVT